MLIEFRIGIVVIGTAAVAIVYRKPIARALRARSYFKGRKIDKNKRLKKEISGTDGLQWGNIIIPDSSATRGFLVGGTTGSGKTHVQRILLKRPLLRMPQEADSRMLIYDAKGDTVPYLKRIGFSGDVFSLNPFESRSTYPQAVGWDAGKDITCPTKAMNLAEAIVPAESGGANQYFTNGSRHIVAGNLKSLIRHNRGDWTFSDLISISLSKDLSKQILSRDSAGQRVIDRYLRDDKTGEDVYSTLWGHVGFFEPIAALWKSAPKQISISDWLRSNSVLLLGRNATASATMKVLNQQIFRFFADHLVEQSNSTTRRTYVWLEEARFAEGIVDSEALQSVAGLCRSKGAVLVISFQDIDGFRHAAGEKQAESLIGQCSHKALLRFETDSSAQWASKLIGQYQAIEVFHNDTDRMLNPESKSEQRVLSDAVLSSEFFSIPETNPDFGLEGYFLAPSRLPNKTWLSPHVVAPVVVSDAEENEHGIKYRSESEQWLPELSIGDADRLGINGLRDQKLTPQRAPSRKLRLKAQPIQTIRSREQRELSELATHGMGSSQEPEKRSQLNPGQVPRSLDKA